MLSILIVLGLFPSNFGSSVPVVGLYQQFPSTSSGEGTQSRQVFGPLPGTGSNSQNVPSGQQGPSSGSRQGSPGTFPPGGPVPDNVGVFGSSSQTNDVLGLVFSNQVQPGSNPGSLTTGTLALQGQLPSPGSPSNPGNLFPGSSAGTFNVVSGSGPEPPVVQAVNLNEEDAAADVAIISFTTFTDTVTVTHTIFTGSTILEPDHTTTTQLVTFHSTHTSRVYVPDDVVTRTFTLTSSITNFNIQTTTTQVQSTWSTFTTSTDILVSTTPRQYDVKLTKILTQFKIVPLVKYTTISLTEIVTVKVPSATTVYSAASKLVTRAY